MDGSYVVRTFITFTDFQKETLATSTEHQERHKIMMHTLPHCRNNATG
jgi:hypothetical protein